VNESAGDALDPQVRELLAVLNGDGSRRLRDLSPAEARRRLEELPDIGPREQPLERVEDLTVAADAGRSVPARLYAANTHPRLPVLVYLHGGGWVTGDLDAGDYRCRRLAARTGCLVLAVDYRLAPEHPFPAAAEDAYAVLQWAFREAGSVGGDTTLVALAGDSSGGNLAAAVTLMTRDRGARAPMLQLLTCPIVELEFARPSMLSYGDGYVLERDDLRWCWDHYLRSDGDADSPYACPLRAESLEGLPPALILTAELDPLRDQGEAYARRLEEAAVPVTLIRYSGMVHSFVDFEGSLDPAADALDRSAGALRAAADRARRPAASG
jgi:acetyl esterase